ncbi:MAG: PAS domain-containing protein, partial [Macromonas sp.]
MNTELLQLRTVLDNVQAYIYTKDVQGRYTYVNPQVGELFGLAPEHIVGRDDRDFLSACDYAQVAANDHHVVQNGQALTVRETRTVGEHQQSRSFLTIKVPLHNEDGHIVGLCGISTDITAQEAAENELRAHRELLDTILSNVDAHIYVKGPDRTYLYANERVAQLYGRTIDDIIGHTDHELLPAQTAAHILTLDDQVFASGQRQAGHEFVRDRDGV